MLRLPWLFSLFPIPFLALAVATTGCPAGDDDDDDDSSIADDDDTTDEGPAPAELAELSSGKCPAIDESATVTFDSGGEERKVTFVVPEELEMGAPVLFFFHGLLSPDYTPEPTTEMASILGLQGLADEFGAIIVLPESRIMDELNMVFFMWEVMERDEADLLLYDDLRTCVVTEAGADIRRISATGFSGGSLFVTVLARERGDTLAVVMENSGGSDVELPFYPMAAEYSTPSNEVLPFLLVSGGGNDGWPTGFPLVNFETATDSLEAHLAEDGFHVIRCKHSFGHTITQTAMNVGDQWLFANSYGEPSPFLESGIEDFGDWCEVIAEP